MASTCPGWSIMGHLHWPQAVDSSDDKEFACLSRHWDTAAPNGGNVRGACRKLAAFPGIEDAGRMCPSDFGGGP